VFFDSLLVFCLCVTELVPAQFALLLSKT